MTHRPQRARTRTALVIAVGLLFGLSACGGDDNAEASDGTTTVKWIYDYFPSSGDAPMLAAEKEGYFADGGLNVKTTAGGEVNQIQDVAIGQHDITVGPATTLLLSIEQGLPVTAVGVSQPASPIGLICTPDSGAVSGDPSSLEGLTIATDPADADGASVWTAFRDKYDLKDKVTELSGSTSEDLIFSGQVDCLPAYLTYMPAVIEEEMGAPPALFELSKEAGVMGQTIVVNNKFLAKHPDAVKAFVDAYAKGMQWTIKNQDAAIDLVTKTYPDLDASGVKAELPTLTTFWHSSVQDEKGLLYVDPDSWETTGKALIGVDSLKKMPALKDFWNTDFLPDPAYLP